jgi:hypothetical protein
MSQLIQDYLLSIEHKLDFDSRLALRAREDIEEYLDELACDQRIGPVEAVKRAISGFGDTDSVARQYAESALSRQIGHTWLSLLLAAIGAFVAMRFRAVSIVGDLSELGSFLLWMDRFALAACVFFAVIGRLGYSGVGFPLQICSPRTAFKIAIFGIGASILFGFARVAWDADTIATSWAFSLVLATGIIEMGILIVAGTRVRKMDQCFDRAYATC